MRICAYCTNIVGMRRQARGLADAIAALVSADANFAGTVEVIDTVAGDSAFGKIMPQLASFFAAPVVPQPDILIACGGASVAGALRAKRDGAFVVYVQKPPLSPGAFDIVVCGMHDNNDRGTDNVITINGSVGGVNAAVLARRKQRARQKFVDLPRPYTALIIGGDNRAYSMTPSLCRRFIDELQNTNDGGSVLASSSRRTSTECRRILADANDASGKNGRRFYYEDNNGDNDAAAREYYYDILAAAERAVVTGDSVNMISEAAAAQIPVYILPLTVVNHSAAVKFRAFHARMTQLGAAVMWNGRFDNDNTDNAGLPPFDETARAAKLIWQRYLAAVC